MSAPLAPEDSAAPQHFIQLTCRMSQLKPCDFGKHVIYAEPFSTRSKSSHHVPKRTRLPSNDMITRSSFAPSAYVIAMGIRKNTTFDKNAGRIAVSHSASLQNVQCVRLPCRSSPRRLCQYSSPILSTTISLAYPSAQTSEVTT